MTQGLSPLGTGSDARGADSLPKSVAFHAPVQRWFEASFPAPTRAQALGWPPVLAGESTLLLAPTGSGKTLAAFLTAIDRLMFHPPPAKKARCRVVYVRPSKPWRWTSSGTSGPRSRGSRHRGHPARAFGRHPHGRHSSERAGPDAPDPAGHPDHHARVAVSHVDLAGPGDPALGRDRHRRRDPLAGRNQARRAPLPLPGAASAIAGRELQRIGLSATQRPLDEVARLLGGGEVSGKAVAAAAGHHRRRRSKKAARGPGGSPGGRSVEARRAGGAAVGSCFRGTGPESIWPSIHPRLLDLIREHRSTMIFVNSRRLAERMAGALNDLAGTEVALAHHGSVARDSGRRWRTGSSAAPCPPSSPPPPRARDRHGVCRSGVQTRGAAVDRVGLQRIGRASHQVGGVPKG